MGPHTTGLVMRTGVTDVPGAGQPDGSTAGAATAGQAADPLAAGDAPGDEDEVGAGVGVGLHAAMASAIQSPASALRRGRFIIGEAMRRSVAADAGRRRERG